MHYKELRFKEESIIESSIFEVFLLRKVFYFKIYSYSCINIEMLLIG